MEPRREYEQEIDLKDLMFAVLRKWRPIVLLAIVFALLLGGFKIFKGLNQLKDEEYVKQNQEEYKASLDQYNATKKRLEKELANIEENIESQQKYKDESILLNINPYDEYMESATFYISTDDALSEPEYGDQHFKGLYVDCAERRYVQLRHQQAEK